MNIFALVNNGKQSSATQTKSVKIAANPNVQSEVSPSKSVFNLNDYYKKGYKTDEQNEDAAKEIRKDILTNYNVSDDDSDKKEKLARIYLDIVEDDANHILSENVKSKGIVYNGNNDEEFIEAVEMSMAHMTHDGTGKGDKIALSEVDFSDIEYNDDPEIGSMTTKTLPNGLEYVIYDSNNNIIKTISQTTDENGLTTIATYSDADKTNLISSERAYEFPKTDDEVKFKFADGNQNTVNFKDNGDDISVEVTKGVLREESTIQKNDDGTYSFDGKQYFTIEEIATDLNKKELRATSEFDGIISASEQGTVKDCALISAINSLCTTEIGREAIKNAVSIDEDGNMTVNFAGIDRKYTITREEFNKKNSFSSGDPEVRAIELAWEKMLNEVKDGVLQRESRQPYHEGQNILQEKLKCGYNIVAGTFANSVYELLTKKYPYLSDYYCTDDLMEQLDKLETQSNRAITVGNVPEEHKDNRLLTGITKCSKSEYTDAYGNQVDIYNLHAYAVKESDTKADGTRIITIINPYDSSKEVVLDEATFLKAFNQAYDVDLSTEKEIPAYTVA